MRIGFKNVHICMYIVMKEIDGGLCYLETFIFWIRQLSIVEYKY